jgi:hypothetical protein
MCPLQLHVSLIWSKKKQKEFKRKTAYNLSNILFTTPRPRQELLEKVSTIEILAIFIFLRKSVASLFGLVRVNLSI